MLVGPQQGWHWVLVGRFDLARSLACSEVVAAQLHLARCLVDRVACSEVVAAQLHLARCLVDRAGSRLASQQGWLLAAGSEVVAAQLDLARWLLAVDRAGSRLGLLAGRIDLAADSEVVAAQLDLARCLVAVARAGLRLASQQGWVLAGRVDLVAGSEVLPELAEQLEAKVRAMLSQGRLLLRP